GALAHSILEILGLPPIIHYLDLPQDDPRQRCPNITKANRDLNWMPCISLAEGLRHTMPYFETELRQMKPALIAE
ncbi:NAD-dependent epimerase/dehydratase, partial [Sulfitobacter indolifex HEL-45]